MNQEQFRQWVDLEERWAVLAQQIEDIKKEHGKLEQQLLEQMAADGVAKLTVTSTGGRDMTVYVQEDRYPKVADPVALADAMKEMGLGQYVRETVNSQSLRGYLLTEIKEGRGIPKPLEGIVEMPPRHSLRMRKAGDSSKAKLERVSQSATST